MSAALSVSQQARYLAVRQSMIAGNVANANTPDYKARDVLPSQASEALIFVALNGGSAAFRWPLAVVDRLAVAVRQQARYLAVRQSMIAGNVANANTPDYKARDVLPFAEVRLTELEVESASQASEALIFVALNGGSAAFRWPLASISLILCRSRLATLRSVSP
jgi:flagellar basal body rod protein FlgB